jgi:Zn finger protein HypA/HybF involved in hydrogenase expression
MRIHSSITEARIIDACKRRMTTLDDPGFCLVCGNEQSGCEPDARRYQCEACGESQVYGAEELALLEIAIDYHTQEDGE